MSDIYAYSYNGKTYINLTNKCTNDCDFCIRRNGDELAGNDLWLKREPSAAEVLEALKNTEKSEEIIFCGYGEPTMRLEVLKIVAAALKKNGYKTRLNTNGLGSAYFEHNIAPELKGVIDTVSVSLNAADADKYDAVCHSVFGKDAFAEMLDFTRACVKEGIKTVMTVVDVIPAEDIEACRAVAEEVGAEFRIREYITDNNA